MQKRITTEILIFKLIMNNMKNRKEYSSLVAWSTEREKLIKYYNQQKADVPYNDIVAYDNLADGSKSWYKVFKKNSPLEWYNNIQDIDQINSYGQGIQEEWLNENVLTKIENRYSRIF